MLNGRRDLIYDKDKMFEKSRVWRADLLRVVSRDTQAEQAVNGVGGCEEDGDPRKGRGLAWRVVSVSAVVSERNGTETSASGISSRLPRVCFALPALNFSLTSPRRDTHTYSHIIRQAKCDDHAGISDACEAGTRR